MPWANGRGTSYEVARGGGDPWSWRVAIAPVVEDGPFSSLPGVDRWLAVINDASIVLAIDGTECVARTGEVVAFAGESQVTAHLPDGPTRDCGLMVRRGAATGSMQVTGPGRVQGTVLVALERASVRADDQKVTLSPGDALLSHEPFDAQIVAGRVVVVTVTANLPAND
jgi:environmental stress-induced protein Ves